MACHTLNSGSVANRQPKVDFFRSDVLAFFKTENRPLQKKRVLLIARQRPKQTDIFFFRRNISFGFGFGFYFILKTKPTDDFGEKKRKPTEAISIFRFITLVAEVTACCSRVLACLVRVCEENIQVLITRSSCRWEERPTTPPSLVNITR